MANDGRKEKVENDIPTGSGKHIDLDVDEDNCNEETRDSNPGEKDVGKEGTYQRNQTAAGIITRTTSRYGKIDACGGTKR
ncbi:hypothetical protein ACSBR2_022678 [Camellia fascicularis]